MQGHRNDIENLYHKKQMLWQQLAQMGCLWSYDKDASFNDDLLIEKALLYLEFEELYKLEELYPKDKLKTVWRERLVSQGAYYDIINWLLAAMFFDIKNPDKYLKRYGKPRMEKRIEETLRTHRTPAETLAVAALLQREV